MLQYHKGAKLHVLGLSLLIVAVLAAAGCSSSSSQGASGNSGTGQSANSSSSSGLQKLVQHSLTPTTKLGQTVPLKSKPPAGKTVDFVGGNLPSNQDVYDGVAAADSAIGWHTKLVPGYNENDPSTLISVLNSALATKPVAVVMTVALPESEWQSELPKFTAAGVALVPMFSGPLSPPTSTMLANLGSPDDVKVMGETVGKWIAADAAKNGGHKKILMFNMPVFPITGAVDAGMKAMVTKYCATCSITEIDGTMTQMTSGTIVPPIVSALQRTQYDYFFSPLGEVTDSLPTSLRTAGVSGVKVASVGCDTTNEDNVLAGTEMACVGYPYVISGWIAVDTILRRVEGMAIPSSDGGFPSPLLLMKQNSSIWKPSITTNEPADYPVLFKRLWLVG